MKITSGDGHVFVVERRAALGSGTIKAMLMSALALRRRYGRRSTG